jgi:tetratricopeptide (TPR) repeat protein
MTDTSKAVFLSYASQDAEAARSLCEALRAGGIEVWFDQSELRGGDAWDASIRRQIRTCALFIPLISRNTHCREEGYFRLKWKLAVDRSHLISAAKAFLLPVVVDDTGDNDEQVPEKFRELQWTRLPGGSTPAAFVERVAHLLSGDQAAVTQPALPNAGQATPFGAATAPASPSTRERAGRFPIWLRIALGVVIAIAAYVAIDKLMLSTIAFGPGEAANYIQLGLVFIVTGRVSEAITALRKGVELDPLSTTGWTMLARAYLFFHDFPAARESAHRALEISPNTPRALGYLGFTQLVEGQATEAMATFRTIQDSRWLMLTGVAMAEHTLGHEQESKAALDELQATDPDAAAYQIAEVHAWRGDKDAAFEWFERAYSQRDAGLTLLTHDPMVDSLRGDPRFTALPNKLHLPQ